MTESRLRPRVVLWWGIGLTLAGILLTTLLPQLGYAVAVRQDAATGVDQGLLVGFDLVVRLIAQVIPPLGVALIGAAIVMAYVSQTRAPAAGAPAPAPADET